MYYINIDSRAFLDTEALKSLRDKSPVLNKHHSSLALCEITVLSTCHNNCAAMYIRITVLCHRVFNKVKNVFLWQCWRLRSETYRTYILSMNDALVFFLKVKKTVPYEPNVKMLDAVPRYYMKDCLAQMME